MNKKYLLISAILVIPFFILACSSTPERRGVSSKSYTPKYSPAKQQNKGQYIVKLASSMLGTPYQYGGHSPEQGFDCSGLVYYTHRNAGEMVPRASYAQLKSSRPIALDEIQPGDLLFYNINGKPSHVGIYIGDEMFIHAPSSGKKVSVTSINNPYFKPRLIRAGRLYQ